MKNKSRTYKNEEARWDGFTKYFSSIDEKDAITTDTYMDVIRMYQEANREKIIVRHMYYNGKAKLKSFIIGFDGTLNTIGVWRETGGYGSWDPELVKLVDRPKRKRAPKVSKPKAKAKPKKKAPPKSTTGRIVKKKKNPPTSCKEHPNYGAIRSPRTDCKSCWKLYYNKHPEKKA